MGVHALCLTHAPYNKGTSQGEFSVASETPRGASEPYYVVNLSSRTYIVLDFIEGLSFLLTEYSAAVNE